MNYKPYALDVDGVLADFRTALIDLAIIRGDIVRRPLWTGWNIPKQLLDTYRDVGDDFWMSVPVIQDSLDSLISEIPAPAFYLTARTVESSVTEAWLKNHGFPSAEVITVPHCDKFLAHDPKLEVLKKRNVSIYVDDFDVTVRHLTKNGINAILYTTYYNTKEKLPRVSSLKQVKDLLEIKENGN